MTHLFVSFFHALRNIFNRNNGFVIGEKRRRDGFQDNDEYLKLSVPKRPRLSSDSVQLVNMAAGSSGLPVSSSKRLFESSGYRTPANMETKENVFEVSSDEDENDNDIIEITPIRGDSRPPLSPLPVHRREHTTKPVSKERHCTSTPLEQNRGISSRFENNGRVSVQLRKSSKPSSATTSRFGTSQNFVRNSALNESIRLDEKRRYSVMLQSFLSSKGTPFPVLPHKPAELPRMNREKLPTSRYLKPQQKSVPSVYVIDLTKGEDRYIPVKQAPNTGTEERHKKKVETVNSFEKKLKSFDFVWPQWIEDMQKTYGAREKERRRDLEEAQIVKDLYEKHNREFADALSERLQRRLAVTEVVLDETEEEEGLLPPLTPEMEKEVKQSFIPTPANEILATGFGQRITRRDICTLAGLSWLNDEVINFYMNLLIERGKNDNLPNIYAFNTFFYPKLTSAGHSALKRWTKKVDIFAQDMVLVPVHLGVHWCMAIIDFRDKTVRYYDSMGGSNNQCLKQLLKYLEDESLDKKKLPYSTDDWKTVNVKNIPQQMNGSDCGMFSCMFAEFISRNARITFTQDDMPYFRKKMAYEILSGKLLT